MRPRKYPKAGEKEHEMSLAAKIRHRFAVLADDLTLVAFLAFRAVAKQDDDQDACANVDDYGECVSEWVEKCLEVDETAVRA